MIFLVAMGTQNAAQALGQIFLNAYAQALPPDIYIYIFWGGETKIFLQSFGLLGFTELYTVMAGSIVWMCLSAWVPPTLLLNICMLPLTK